MSDLEIKFRKNFPVLALLGKPVLLEDSSQECSMKDVREAFLNFCLNASVNEMEDDQSKICSISSVFIKRGSSLYVRDPISDQNRDDEGLVDIESYDGRHGGHEIHWGLFFSERNRTLDTFVSSSDGRQWNGPLFRLKFPKGFSVEQSVASIIDEIIKEDQDGYFGGVFAEMKAYGDKLDLPPMPVHPAPQTP